MTQDTDYIKFALKERASIEPAVLTVDALRAAGCLDRVAVLPKGTNDRFRYLGDLLVQMVRSAKTDDQLRATVGTLTQSLSYLLNSKSWSDGKLHDFDDQELRRKLQRFTMAPRTQEEQDHD